MGPIITSKRPIRDTDTCPRQKDVTSHALIRLNTKICRARDGKVRDKRKYWVFRSLDNTCKLVYIYPIIAKQSYTKTLAMEIQNTQAAGGTLRNPPKP
jgi:hypothetical protein